MNEKKLTVKDSSISFIVSFWLCQLGVIVATCLTYIFFKIFNIDTSNFLVFFNTATGYLISSIALDFVIVLVFLFFNKGKTNKITSKLSIKKILMYSLIAVCSFLCLYPLVVCIDSLLIKCGISLSTLPYELTTKNYFISLISLVLAPAVCEELLFRGIIFSGLKSHGKIFSVSITAVMFCLFHMSISQTVYPLLMGLLLSVIMYYENNIYYCILVHGLNNFLSLTLSYFKINLVFNHWTYILLAIVLAIIFISIVIYFIIKKNKQEEKVPVEKSNKIYLFAILAIMSVMWLILSFG